MPFLIESAGAGPQRRRPRRCFAPSYHCTTRGPMTEQSICYRLSATSIGVSVCRDPTIRSHRNCRNTRGFTPPYNVRSTHEAEEAVPFLLFVANPAMSVTLFDHSVDGKELVISAATVPRVAAAAALKVMSVTPDVAAFVRYRAIHRFSRQAHARNQEP